MRGDERRIPRFTSFGDVFVVCVALSVAPSRGPLAWGEDVLGMPDDEDATAPALVGPRESHSSDEHTRPYGAPSVFSCGPAHLPRPSRSDLGLGNGADAAASGVTRLAEG